MLCACHCNMGTPPPPPPPLPHWGQCRDVTFIKSNAPRLGIHNRSNSPYISYRSPIHLFRVKCPSIVKRKNHNPISGVKSRTNPDIGPNGGTHVTMTGALGLCQSFYISKLCRHAMVSILNDCMCIQLICR